MPTVTLTNTQIRTGMTRAGIFLGPGQFTFSIPTALSIWPTYGPGEEQDDPGYALLNAAQATAFRNALSLWDALIAPDFVEVADNATTRGEIRVAFTGYDMDANTAAYAYLPTTQTPTSFVSDVWINAVDAADDFSSGANFDTLLHELGHALGLKHPFSSPAIEPPYDNVRYTIMSYTSPGRVVTFTEPSPGNISSRSTAVAASTPMVIDIAAVQLLYGAETTTFAGDTNYVLSQTDPTVRTIYDAGGNDTMDLSATTRNNIVSLIAGSYSSIGYWTKAEQTAFWQSQFNPGFNTFISNQINQSTTWEWQDNVGIALNTVIENVIGGSGNETMVGNDADNMFYLQNGGNDTVDGGAGNDGFSFGTAWTSADVVNGGAGTNDQIALQGNYTGGNAIALNAGSITGVEVFTLLGGAGNGYTVTTLDANVAAGTVLTFFGTNLAAGNAFTFNGALETDGAFRVYGGAGLDNFTGGAGNDGFWFGPSRFTGADTVNGGAGTNDQLALDGDYTITLTSASMQGIETVTLQAGPVGDRNVFNITLADDVIAPGTLLTIWGLLTTEGFSIDGSAESSGSLRVFGGLGADGITGGAGQDRLFGGEGGDSLNGGLGNDTFVYDAVSQSTGVNYDQIDFTSGDLIDFNFTVSGIATTVQGGALSSASFDANLAAAVGTSQLGVGQAVLFRADAGDLAGTTFLVVDANGQAGYQAGQDYVILLTGNPTILPPTLFV